MFLNVPFAFRIEGPVDVSVLRKSLQEIVKRHDAFRLVFSERRGQAIQQLGKIHKVKVSLVDLRKYSLPDAEAQAEQLSIEDARIPFHLGSGPLFRICLLRLPQDLHILFITLHHIICDHWSIHVVRRELSVLYAAFLAERRSPLPPASVRFVDFASWEQLLIKKNLLQSQLSYWNKQLSGPIPLIKFRKTSDRKKPVSFRTSTREMTINEPLISRVRNLAREQSSTVYMVLLSVLNVVLCRHTGHRELWIGTTVANRGRLEFEDAVGYFVNGIVLRNQLSMDMTFKELLQRIQGNALEAFANQDLPLGYLARALNRNKRSEFRKPLIQVMFVYKNLIFPSIKEPGLKFLPSDGSFRKPPVDFWLTDVDLFFDIFEVSTKVTGSLICKSAVIDHEEMVELLNNFNIMVTKVVNDPDCQIVKL